MKIFSIKDEAFALVDVINSQHILHTVELILAIF